MVAYNGIAFGFDPSLGDTVYASNPSEYVDGYTRFAFAPAGYCREIGCVEVFEVQAYEEAFPARPLPPVGAATILRAQDQPLEFQGGSGTRSVKMYAQNIYWVHNDAIVYEYRGFTEDDRYYVLVTFPIDAPILLSSSDPEQNTNENALPLSFHCQSILLNGMMPSRSTIRRPSGSWICSLRRTLCLTSVYWTPW